MHTSAGSGGDSAARGREGDAAGAGFVDSGPAEDHGSGLSAADVLVGLGLTFNKAGHASDRGLLIKRFLEWCFLSQTQKRPAALVLALVVASIGALRGVCLCVFLCVRARTCVRAVCGWNSMDVLPYLMLCQRSC